MEKILLETIDYHVHTNRSACCQSDQTLAKLIRWYAEKGFAHVAICDHYYPGQLQTFEEARREVDELIIETGMDVRLSAEIDVADASGNLAICCDEEYRALLQLLDHISAAPHTKTLVRAHQNDKTADKDIVSYIHRAHMAAVTNPDIDVILHPWDGAEAVVDSLYSIDAALFTEFAVACTLAGKIVEVSNCMNHYWMRPALFTESYEVLVKALVAAETPLVVGSDGHNMSLVPQAPHLSTAVTTGDTSWAVAVIIKAGGSDTSVRFPERHHRRHP